jgi:hypothetical protein
LFGKFLIGNVREEIDSHKIFSIPVDFDKPFS